MSALYLMINSKMYIFDIIRHLWLKRHLANPNDLYGSLIDYILNIAYR